LNPPDTSINYNSFHTSHSYYKHYDYQCLQHPSHLCAQRWNDTTPESPIHLAFIPHHILHISNTTSIPEPELAKMGLPSDMAEAQKFADTNSNKVGISLALGHCNNVCMFVQYTQTNFKVALGFNPLNDSDWKVISTKENYHEYRITHTMVIESVPVSRTTTGASGPSGTPVSKTQPSYMIMWDMKINSLSFPTLSLYDDRKMWNIQTNVKTTIPGLFSRSNMQFTLLRFNRKIIWHSTE
jgi:hypothetical protein